MGAAVGVHRIGDDLQPCYDRDDRPMADSQTSANSSWRSARHVQPFAWLAFAVIYFAFDQGRAPDDAWFDLIARALLWCLLGAAVSGALLSIYGRTLRDPRPWLVILVAVVASAVGGAAWMVGFNNIDGLLSVEPGWEPLHQWPREQLYVEWMDSTLMLMVWHGVVYSFVQSQRANVERERALRLQQANTQAQLIALRTQLNPHFLFNALNAAMELVHEDAARAEDVLQRLSSLLRRRVLSTEPHCSLTRELNLIRDYLAIEQVRFEEQLHVSWNIQETVRQASIPSSIVLPLVDNAIKHGTSGPDTPLHVEIEAQASDGKLVLNVRNTGSLNTQRHPRSLGRGLAALRERLQLEFDDAATVELREAQATVVATLTLPLSMPACPLSPQQDRTP